ncbi:MAG: restriction endonuclease [Euryarchaeota archaeon]|nr:restriction endonuclease [Euryarchaeota archaeon]
MKMSIIDWLSEHRIFGFRSKTPWKMMVATIGYLLLLLFAFSGLEAFALVVIAAFAIAVYTDFLSIRSRMLEISIIQKIPGFRSGNKNKMTIAIVGYGFILLVIVQIAPIVAYIFILLLMLCLGVLVTEEYGSRKRESMNKKLRSGKYICSFVDKYGANPTDEAYLELMESLKGDGIRLPMRPVYLKVIQEQERRAIQKIQEQNIISEQKRRAFERRQKAKGLIKYKGKWGTPEQVREWKEIEIGLANNFVNLTSSQFERFTARLFQKMGYTAQITPGTGDFGADIIAKKKDETVLIEVKKYSEGNNVAPRDVQRTLGALWKHKADKAVFITTSDFTIRAREIEKEAPIELWNKRILHEMIKEYFMK